MVNREFYSDLTVYNPYDYETLEEWQSVHRIDPNNMSNAGRFICMEWEEAWTNLAYEQDLSDRAEALRDEWESLDSCQKLEILLARQLLRKDCGWEEPTYYDRFYPLGEGEDLKDFPIEFEEPAPIPPASTSEADLLAFFGPDYLQVDVDDDSAEEELDEEFDLDTDLDRRQRQALVEGLPPEELPGEMDPDEYYSFKANYTGLPASEIDASGRQIYRYPGGLSESDFE